MVDSDHSNYAVASLFSGFILSEHTSFLIKQRLVSSFTLANQINR